MNGHPDQEPHQRVLWSLLDEIDLSNLAIDNGKEAGGIKLLNACFSASERMSLLTFPTKRFRPVLPDDELDLSVPKRDV